MSLIIDLTGTVTLVTGAGRGLGRAAALALAAAGANIALTGRNPENLASVADEVMSLGVTARVFPADITDPAQVTAMVEDVTGAFGRLDVLVNNAGVSGDAKRFTEVTPTQWQQVISVNLIAPATCAAVVAPLMIAQGGGRIINVASIAGQRPMTSLSPYCASKAGLIQLTRVMALELTRHNVLVNAICPGYFDTPMNHEFFSSEAGQEVIRREIPMRRIGEPATEFGPAMVFLASTAASFMAGSVLNLDGGHSLT